MPHGINWHCCLLGVAKVHIFHNLTKYKQVFIWGNQCFLGKQFGSFQQKTYICSVKGGTKQSHDVRNGGMAAVFAEMMSNSTLPLGFIKHSDRYSIKSNGRFLSKSMQARINANLFRKIQLHITSPPMSGIYFQKFFFCIPIIADIHRMAILVFLRRIHQPMCRAQQTTDVVSILLFVIRVIP